MRARKSSDAVEDDGAAAMAHQARRRRRRLDHGALRREVAARAPDAAERLDRPVERPDDLIVENAGGVGDRSPMVWPLTVTRVAMETAGEDLHDRRHAAGIVEVLHQEAARGHQVDEAGHVAAEPVPVGEREVDTERPASASRCTTALVEPPMAPLSDDGVLQSRAGDDRRHRTSLPRPVRRCACRHPRRARRGGCRRRESRRSGGARCRALRRARPWSRRCPWSCRNPPSGSSRSRPRGTPRARSGRFSDRRQGG